jgi:hypothetical protein
VQQIANLADSDARRALHWLLQTTLSAERKNADRICLQHIPSAARAWSQMQQTALRQSLPAHLQIIYGLAKKHSPVASRHLRQLYLLQCHKQSIEPAAPRTFSKYLALLIRRGLMEAHYQPGIGPGRMLRTIA